MHGHVSKCEKMHKKPIGGTNKHGKHIITWSRKGKGAHGATPHLEMPPKWLHPDMASWVSDATTQPHTHYGCQMWQSLEQERLT